MTVVDRPAVLGNDVEVPLVTGERRRYVNLDYAASAPPLVDVAHAVDALLPWYSSVHRGAGYKSQVCTSAYEAARNAVRRFLRARPGDAVIFTRNTTDSINLLTHCLPPDAAIITSPIEHHADLLPWRRRRVSYLDLPVSADGLLASLEERLDAATGAPTLVAVTGASNVTGEIWPIAAITDLAHRHGARVLVDAAQLAPHVAVDMEGWDVDYLALSGHKLYAPYGVGALVGRADWLEAGTPCLMGGGAVEFVTLDDVIWRGLPERQEAGSPNVVGAVALGAACEVLAAYGMDRVMREEADLYQYARQQLLTIPGLRLYALWDDSHPRIGVLTFNLEGYAHSRLAAILSAEYGIGLRHGCFCAHPLMVFLLHISCATLAQLRVEIEHGYHARVPGAVRMSFGLGTTVADVDWAVEALREIAERGPAWTYRQEPDSGEYVPDPDTRLYPVLPFRTESTWSAAGESS